MNRLSLVLTALTLACASAPPKPEATGTSDALVYETYTVGGAKPEGLLVALHERGAARRLGGRRAGVRPSRGGNSGAPCYL